MGGKRDMGRVELNAYVFPGQGSQQKGMCESLFQEFPHLLEISDEILGYSLKTLCLSDPDNLLNQTEFTQPALYVANVLSYEHAIKEGKPIPDYVAGHSLGEYSALYCAGAFDFATGLKLVKKRGELMQKARNGIMVAVINLESNEISRILQENHITTVDLANMNTKYQTIISGEKEDVLVTKEILEKYKKVRCIPLNTSGAFHSRFMKPAKEEFLKTLEVVSFKPLIIPVISNYTARPYLDGQTKTLLAEQMDHPVNWLDSMRYLMGKGIDADHIIQIGPGNVLTNMISKIKVESEPLIIKDDEEILQQSEQFVKKPLDMTQSQHPLIEEGHILGNAEFKKANGLQYAYLCGPMYCNISSSKMVVELAKAGMLGFLGTDGCKVEQIKKEISIIHNSLEQNEAFGVSITWNPNQEETESELIQLCINENIRRIEASEYMMISKNLVKYRVQGLYLNEEDSVVVQNHIFAKLSRIEVAEIFMSPPPEKIITELLKTGEITELEAKCASRISIADNITIADYSMSYTGTSHAVYLISLLKKSAQEHKEKYGYTNNIAIGATGGIGNPETAAAAFYFGADYIQTGSINQSCMEANVNHEVKDILQKIDIYDTEFASCENMFELGAKVQVVKKGLFYQARANHLYDLYRQYNSIDELNETTKQQLEGRYLKKSFENVYNEIQQSVKNDQQYVNKEKLKMLQIFKWYFEQSREATLRSDPEWKMDYQIRCSNAMGLMNRWLMGTPYEDWKSRSVVEIGKKLLDETVGVLKENSKKFIDISKN